MDGLSGVHHLFHLFGSDALGIGWPSVSDTWLWATVIYTDGYQLIDREIMKIHHYLKLIFLLSLLSLSSCFDLRSMLPWTMLDVSAGDRMPSCVTILGVTQIMPHHGIPSLHVSAQAQQT